MTRSQMRRAAAASVGLALSFGLGAGCSGAVPGEAQPRPSASSAVSSESALPKAGAPKIEHPLRADQFVQAPCTVLTEGQLGDLGVQAKGKPEPNASLGPDCVWGDTGGRTKGTYTAIFVKGGAGLSGSYGNRDSSFFKEIPDVAGQPAVINMASDLRASGDCTINVGLNDKQVIAIGAGMDQGAPNYKNPCGVAAKLGEKMVETIRGVQ